MNNSVRAAACRRPIPWSYTVSDQVYFGRPVVSPFAVLAKHNEMKMRSPPGLESTHVVDLARKGFICYGIQKSISTWNGMNDCSIAR